MAKKMTRKVKKDSSFMYSIVLSVIIIGGTACAVNWVTTKTVSLQNSTEKLRADFANFKQRNFNLQTQVERYTSWEYISTFVAKNSLPLRSANIGQVFILSGEVFAIKGATKKENVVSLRD